MAEQSCGPRVTLLGCSPKNQNCFLLLFDVDAFVASLLGSLCHGVCACQTVHHPCSLVHACVVVCLEVWVAPSNHSKYQSHSQVVIKQPGTRGLGVRHRGQEQGRHHGLGVRHRGQEQGRHHGLGMRHRGQEQGRHHGLGVRHRGQEQGRHHGLE